MATYVSVKKALASVLNIGACLFEPTPMSANDPDGGATTVNTADRREK